MDEEVVNGFGALLAKRAKATTFNYSVLVAL
jgi:hypothetical protein